MTSQKHPQILSSPIFSISFLTRFPLLESPPYLIWYPEGKKECLEFRASYLYGEPIFYRG